MHRLFASYRAASTTEKLKGPASEMFGVYGLVRHFVETRLGRPPTLAPHRDSYDVACAIVDTFVDIKRGVVSHEDGARCLEVAIKDLMIKHMAAYGTNKFTPKYYWLHDIKEQVLLYLIGVRFCSARRGGLLT